MMINKKLPYAIFTLLIFFHNTIFAKVTFETEKWVTDNGVHVVFYQAPEVPILDISLAFAAGSAFDGKNFGLSTLTTQLLNQGNNGFDAKTIAEQIENTGAQFSVESARDTSILKMRTLTKPDALTSAIKSFNLIIAHPDFPESAFVQEKNQQLASIQQVQDSPEEVANQLFFQALYQNHPYGHPSRGDKEHVQAIKLQQVRDFYHQYFVGNNATLVLVGAIDSITAHQIANTITSGLTKGQHAPSIPTATALTKAITIHQNFPSTQTVLHLGQLGITYQDPRYFALYVGNVILGGPSLVSDLAIELREKRGLTYGAYSQYSPMLATGPFVISLSTRHSQAPLATKLTIETLENFIKNGPGEEQVKATKQFLTGSFPLSLASNRNIADILLKIEFYHLPNDYLKNYLNKVNKISAQEIKQAFSSQINPKALLLVSVGKE